MMNPLPKALSASRKRILLVDDSDTVRTMTEKVLRREGYEVVTSDNPIMLAFLVRSERPDLVLLDVDIPILSGDAAAAILLMNAGAPRPKFLLYSARPRADLAARVARCGVDGFIEKSGGPSHLVERVQAILGSARGSATGTDN